jgi:hypothetical protein
MTSLPVRELVSIEGSSTTMVLDKIRDGNLTIRRAAGVERGATSSRQGFAARQPTEGARSCVTSARFIFGPTGPPMKKPGSPMRAR